MIFLLFILKTIFFFLFCFIGGFVMTLGCRNSNMKSYYFFFAVVMIGLLVFV